MKSFIGARSTYEAQRNTVDFFHAILKDDLKIITIFLQEKGDESFVSVRS